jgi:microcin C transport system permease protein
VLPNAMVAAMTYMPFILTGAITALTALDFLGFGLPVDAPSFGRLLAQAKSNVEAPWIGLSVFVTLAAMLTLLIFIGEAVRDAFDPRRTFADRTPPEPAPGDFITEPKPEPRRAASAANGGVHEV